MAIPRASEDRWLIDLVASRDAHELQLSGSDVPYRAWAESATPWTIRSLALTERCDVRFEEGRPPERLTADDGPPFRFMVVVSEAPRPREAARSGLVLRAELRRDGVVIGSERLSAIFESGLAFAGARALRVKLGVPFAWILALVARNEVAISAGDTDAFLARLVAECTRGSYELPEAIPIEAGALVRTHVRVRVPDPSLDAAPRSMPVEVAFQYGDARVGWHQAPDLLVFDAAHRKVLARDADAEQRAIAELLSAGFRWPKTRRFERLLSITTSRLTQAIIALPPEHFVVEADGIVYRRASSTSLSIDSGIDWFDLQATIDFDGMTVSAPALLQAAKRGEKLVRLDDGSIGVLPEEWLSRIARVTGFAEESPEGSPGAHEGEPPGAALRLRFGRAQIALVDALLADDRSPIVWDGPLASLRAQLAGPRSIHAAQPSGFRGELRPYQLAGLAWMQWLEGLGFSGCLADDMGLGKTVQVLALLADRKTRDRADGPSLIVAPRSVVYNWLDEAARFAPSLRVAELRLRTLAEDARTTDVLVTTYAVLRRAAQQLASLSLDYVIVDEAHAIKNAAAQTSRAARLLRSRHRLALTGTPVENHLGELVALFDFLNPRMLGGSVRESARRGYELDRTVAGQIGRGLRPFVLQRKKADVLSELPPRIDQTIACVMEEEQRTAYDKVKRYYQAKLLGKIESEGLDGSQFAVLEALLRLRQIACHPGLVDPSLKGRPSVKLDVLLEYLTPIARRGKKALVFSQFTTLLDIVGRAIEAQGLQFERLDGKTADRKGAVERFQGDPRCSVFLVSLKAGGVGLNLTAAEYVFLLDPWWNPAAEAQAIDRAHRIGQRSTVFAYRLLCKDSIEERVAELQAKKRALVSSVFSETEGMRLGSLSAADVESLLR